jgi:NAD(P)H-dependent FMN reductase
MSKPTLQVIIGSTRPGRVGPVVARWFSELAAAHGAFEIETVDLAEVGLPLLDEPVHPALGRYQHEHTRAWSAIVSRGDAYVFVCASVRERERESGAQAGAGAGNDGDPAIESEPVEDRVG